MSERFPDPAREPEGRAEAMDDGTASAATGATRQAPTSWLRGAVAGDAVPADEPRTG